MFCDVFDVYAQRDLKQPLPVYQVFISNCKASVPQKEVCSLWISLVQAPPSVNTQLQKARGIWPSNEPHPDAPCSSGQTQIKKNKRTFLPVPPDQTKSHPLVRKVATLVLAVFILLGNFLHTQTFSTVFAVAQGVN